MRHVRRVQDCGVVGVERDDFFRIKRHARLARFGERDHFAVAGAEVVVADQRLGRLAVTGEKVANVCHKAKRGRAIGPTSALRDRYAASYARYRKLYPALNHLGIAGEGDGNLAEYAKPGHVDAQLIGDVAAWVRAH